MSSDRYANIFEIVTFITYTLSHTFKHNNYCSWSGMFFFFACLTSPKCTLTTFVVELCHLMFWMLFRRSTLWLYWTNECSYVTFCRNRQSTLLFGNARQKKMLSGGMIIALHRMQYSNQYLIKLKLIFVT